MADPYVKLAKEITRATGGFIAACWAAAVGGERGRELVDAYVEELMRLNQAVGEAYVGAWGWLGQPWFDHRFDWLRGPANRGWLERAMYAMRYVRPDDRVLDLCCGDGFCAGHWLGQLAKTVDGLDRDEAAIELANRLHARDNVRFYRRDAATDDFPAAEYDAVLWFAAIEHFSAGDGARVLGKVAKCLAPGGLLLGSTLLGESSNPEHDNEFLSETALRDFLAPCFGSVETWLSRWDEQRTEMYFLCREPLHEK